MTASDTGTAAVVDATAHSRNNMLLRIAFVLYIAALAGLCVWQHRTLFSWPAGIVTGNLLASAIWAPLAVIHLDRLARLHHRQHMAQQRQHHLEHLLVIGGHRKVMVDGSTGAPVLVPVAGG